MMNWLLAIMVVSQSAAVMPVEEEGKRNCQSLAVMKKLEALTKRVQGLWIGARIKKGLAIEEVRRFFGEDDQPLIFGALSASSVYGRWDYVEYGLSISFDNRSGDLRVHRVDIRPFWK
jgi:hypothetical protein